MLFFSFNYNLLVSSESSQSCTSLQSPFFTVAQRSVGFHPCPHLGLQIDSCTDLRLEECAEDKSKEDDDGEVGKGAV